MVIFLGPLNPNTLVSCKKMKHLNNQITTSKKYYDFKFLFAITAADVVPCCGPKKSPVHHSADYILLLFL